MKVIPKLTITDSMLTASSAPETAPAAYSALTSYSIGDQASTGTVGGVITVYISLANTNLGNTPSSSPTQWKRLGDTYSTYDAAHTYADGDFVVVMGTNSHLVYKSIQAANIGQTPATNPTWWVLQGPSNRWALFDELRITQTKAASPFILTVVPGQRINSIALMGVECDQINITATSVAAGGTVRTESINMRLRETLTWSQYFFGSFGYRSAVAFFDFPPYTDLIINLEFIRATGDCKVGTVAVGNFVFIGNVKFDAVSDVLNFSTVTRDNFGDATFNPVRNIPKNDQILTADKVNVNQIAAARDALNGKTAIWSALDDISDGYFEALFIQGFYRRFSINLGEADVATITLELEET